AVLDAAGLDATMLPELTAGTQAVGAVTSAFADATGLSPGTVVAVGCGDEMAATLGAGVFSPGEVCDVVGTAEPVCAASAEPREDPTMLVECHPHADPDTWPGSQQKEVLRLAQDRPFHQKSCERVVHQKYFFGSRR